MRRTERKLTHYSRPSYLIPNTAQTLHTQSVLHFIRTKKKKRNFTPQWGSIWPQSLNHVVKHNKFSNSHYFLIRQITQCISKRCQSRCAGKIHSNYQKRRSCQQRIRVFRLQVNSTLAGWNKKGKIFQHEDLNISLSLCKKVLPLIFFFFFFKTSIRKRRCG